jgi:hypothetical protein
MKSFDQTGCRGQVKAVHSLPAIVRHYASNFRDKARNELAFFKKAPTFRDAIGAAARSEIYDDDKQRWKRLSHQSRITKAAIRRATTALLGAADWLDECADFDQLLAEVERAIADIPGIGELYVYDVTLRIAAWKDLSPDKVYLHCGTRDGAKALGLDVRGKVIERSLLPPALRKLPATDLENMLCIYKSSFRRKRGRNLIREK